MTKRAILFPLFYLVALSIRLTRPVSVAAGPDLMMEGPGSHVPYARVPFSSFIHKVGNYALLAADLRRYIYAGTANSSICPGRRTRGTTIVPKLSPPRRAFRL
ncbi:hypothetical protein GGR56DRAFT_657759, partial [Xylariaceae sp. FL0804]